MQILNSPLICGGPWFVPMNCPMAHPFTSGDNHHQQPQTANFKFNSIKINLNICITFGSIKYLNLWEGTTYMVSLSHFLTGTGSKNLDEGPIAGLL